MVEIDKDKDHSTTLLKFINENEDISFDFVVVNNQFSSEIME